MLQDYTVHIAYYNRNLEAEEEKDYALKEYCRKAKCNLTRAIQETEKALSSAMQKEKNEWSEETLQAFSGIRKRLLGTANDIERLPLNLRCKGQPISSMPSDVFVADLLQGVK